MFENLKREDPQLFTLISQEITRQKDGLVLIPSENYASLAVLEAMATPLSNKYSEGYPQKRYYAGNEFVDQIEKVAIERAKKLFRAEHANVQPHSGSQANAAVYAALLKPGDKVLGFDLAAGGHLSHGSPVNFSGQFYHFEHYNVDPKTERLDYDQIEALALKFKPHLIIASTTSYSRTLDFEKFRAVADKIGAYLMADISHIAGLVVAGLHPHPFPWADVVTTTTHKTLRGPRGGLILSQKEDRISPQDKFNLAQKIDKAVFPGIQGGPLEHVIASKAVCFLEAMQPQFQDYQRQIILNTQAMAKTFQQQGLRVVSGGTDNHLLVLDISKLNLDSKEIQDELDEVGIYLNRNAIPFDKRNIYHPSGLRLGSPAITSRGMKEKEASLIASFVAEVINHFDEPAIKEEVRQKVKALTKAFPIYRKLEL